ncbi:T9SS type A sorting domain-containing protein [Spirosoma aerophilum]
MEVSKPKNDYQGVINATSPGDTVYFMNGTYSNICAGCNTIEIKNSGKANAYIVFINYPGHHPKIKFDGWQGIAIVNGASYIKIIGFDIEGNNSQVSLKDALVQPGSCNNANTSIVDARFNGNGIGVTKQKDKHSHHLVFSKNLIHDCGGGGIGVNQSDCIIIEDNIIYNNCWYSIYGSSGISIYQLWNFDNVTSCKNFIRRNKCFNNINYVPNPSFNCLVQDGNGIIIDDSRNTQNGSTLNAYKGKTLIENNIVWYNGGSGIHTFLSENIDIINNTAYLNNQSPEINSGQILANSSNNVKVINNILYAPSGKMINNSYNNKNVQYYNNLHFNGTTAILNNSSCINKDPLFITANKSLQADFHTYNTSATIDAGNPTFYSQTDIELTKRPIGKLPDIGAFENLNARIGDNIKYFKPKQDLPSMRVNESTSVPAIYPKINENTTFESLSQLDNSLIDCILLTPNPAASQLKVKFKLVKGQKAYLSIYNMNGEVLNNIQVIGNGNIQSEEFMVEELKEGRYIVGLNYNKNMITKLLLISKTY